jgi:hypothetical protein
MSYLLFGVTRAGHPLPGRPTRTGTGSSAKHPERNGHAQQANDFANLELVEAHDLAVVARPMGRDEELSEDDAFEHLDVLVQLVRDGPVLPLRFGTISPDLEAVRTEVVGTAVAPDLRLRLDAIEDLVEVRITFALDEDTLQLLFNEDPELRAVASRSRPDAGLAERVEVGRLVAERLAVRRANLIGSWLATLGEFVEGTTSLAASDEGWEQIALLVRRDQLSDMDAAVAELATQVGSRARIDYVGPLPIYSFDDTQTLSAVTAPAEGTRWGW